MSLTKEDKTGLIEKYSTHDGDTGSPEVQIAILTTRILKLSDHLKTFRKDNHSRRGLLQMVGKRRRLIEYLKGVSQERYQKMAKSLKL